ncbi:MAG: M12 family metallo-peptidase [Granulosicoccus sp.]
MRSIAFCLSVVFLTGFTVTANAGQADQWYEQSLQLIEQKQYRQALSSLRKLQRAHPSFRQMSAVQTRIAVLQESHDAGGSLAVFLRALALRDKGRIDSALAELASIADAYPVGSLTDDALYISAYLHVMDRYDFAAARQALAKLSARFPESAYTDSARYLDAIALEQLGDTAGAKQLLLELRAQHTALNLPLNFRWPKGTALSRYWFDRADRRLAIVEERLASASQLISRSRGGDGKLRVSVSVGGEDMNLVLVPSPLTRATQWLDGDQRVVLPPAIGVFDGYADGIADSWARVVLVDNHISGAVYYDGEPRKLQPATLKGTLDYYQPRSKKPAQQHADSALAARLQGLDSLIPPPIVDFSPDKRSRSVITDMRAVPLSIVVDSQYDRYYAGAGMASAINHLNVADGVYRQFGFALMLDEALTLGSDTDPLSLGSVSLETILRAFRDYRLQNHSIFKDSALSYLFTGNPKTDVTLGLAWIDTACRTDGYDVGVTTPSAFGDVLLTHEIGHSLGAYHDSDTACSDNNLFLMWPNISGRTQAKFSQCSKQSIVPTRSKPCLKNSVDLHLQAKTTGAAISFVINNPDDELTLDAKLLIETSRPDQLIWPDGCLASSPTSAECFIDEIGPIEQRHIVFSVNTGFQGGDDPVTAQLVPLGTLELREADNRATASPGGGTSENHLSISATAVDNTETRPSNTQSPIPSTGAASSAGSTDMASLVILFLLLGWLHRVYRWPFTQSYFELQPRESGLLARLPEALYVRVTQQLDFHCCIGRQ